MPAPSRAKGSACDEAPSVRGAARREFRSPEARLLVVPTEWRSARWRAAGWRRRRRWWSCLGGRIRGARRNLTGAGAGPSGCRTLRGHRVGPPEELLQSRARGRGQAGGLLVGRRVPARHGVGERLSRLFEERFVAPQIALEAGIVQHARPTLFDPTGGGDCRRDIRLGAPRVDGRQRLGHGSAVRLAFAGRWRSGAHARRRAGATDRIQVREFSCLLNRALPE